MLVLGETISKAVESLFTDRQIKPNVEASISDDDRNIQISTALSGASIDDIHYELYLWKIELHFEEQYAQDEKITDLIDFLKDKIGEVEYKWEDPWQPWGNKWCRCQWTKELTSEDCVKNVEAFIEKFDELIGVFNELIKQNEKSDNYKGGTAPNIEEGEVTLKSLSLEELFERPLRIPDYQRIYCWEDKNVTELWSSLMEIPTGGEYHLGAIILHKKKNGEYYDIIDGQQRLVTLTLILNSMGYYHTPLRKARFESKEARDHVANTKWLLEHLGKEIRNDNAKREKFIENLKKLKFSVLILNGDNLDLAYTFFSNQNSKGVPLSDYDLLKAHHLRYIYIEAEQEHLAQRWNEFTKNEDESHVLSQVLGTHLFRLRNWMRKRGFDEGRRLRVKEEFSAAPIMRGIPPFGEKFEYYEKIQGGSHFFAYTDRFVYLYDRFIKTSQVQLLRNHLQFESHHLYGSVIETFLFAYYLKFGEQYLSEALFCIAGVMAQHRYAVKSTRWKGIKDYATNSEIVMMIDQATSPTFFLAEAMPLIRKSGRGNDGIRGRFYSHLQYLFNELTDFTDKTIINKRQYEYGKR